MDETDKKKKFTPPPLPLKGEESSSKAEDGRVFSPPPLPNDYGSTIGNAEVAAERISAKENTKKKEVNVTIIFAITVVIIIAVIGFGMCKSIIALNNHSTVASTENGEIVCINQNILSDVSSTYREIEKKYGKMIESDYLDGGRYFMFENSPAIYYFMDKEGNCSSPYPSEDNWCYCMDIAVKNFFDNFNISKNISDLEQELGVSMEVLVNDMTEGYTCCFEYNGYDIQIDMGESETTINENRVLRVFDNELRRGLK